VIRPAALAALLALAPAADSAYRVSATAAARASLLAAEAAAWAPAREVRFGPAPYETAFRALWSGEGLYVRFDARDPRPWSTLTARDAHLWEEEVVEVFLDLDRSGRDYAELEINPANVVCDVRMVTPWPDKKGDFSWDLAGLETRVTPLVAGEGKGAGWTATAFLPWSGFRSLPSAQRISLPPRPGDVWRFNAFRVERPGGPTAPDAGVVEAALSPPPGESFHVPSAFRDLVFAGPR